MPKVTQELTIANKLGLHARAASELAKTASHYDCDIKVVCCETVADSKSILSLMCLSAAPGQTIKVTADGTDAHEAVRAIAALVEANFNER